MADNCIEIVNKQQRFSQQNQNVSESPESNDSSTNTAILDADKMRNETTNSTNLETTIGGVNRNIETLYLETPVLDDNKEHLGIHITATNSQQQSHCRGTSCMLDSDGNDVTPKPKRLSDEFTTADDRENEENGNKGVELNYASDCGSDVVDSSEMHDIDDNKSTATIFGGAAVDDEISTCSLNLISENNPAPQHLEDSSSPHSSISTDMLSDASMREQNSVNVSDVIEELTNQGDEHPQHRIAHDNHMFNTNSNLDVQSMDAIERSDFEIEQKATASRILGGSSLILRDGNDVRLNLGFINKHIAENQSDIVELIDPAADDDHVNSKPGKSSTCTSAQASCSSRSSLVTTPTTSRNKRSRFNLSKSLEKCPEQPERSANELVQFFDNQFGTDEPAAEVDMDAEAIGSERGQSDEDDVDADADDEDDDVQFADADEHCSK